MSTPPSFQLNGTEVSLTAADPNESLLRWLNRRHCTGTKEGCADGDCGACTVAIVDTDCNGRSRFRSINSCLLPMGALPGREVTTVEALAQGEVLHPVQQAMVDSAGSQCGYCTPGFVMSLFAGYYAGELDDHTFEGNLCRCTGYLPIRAAAERLRERRVGVDASVDAANDRFAALLAHPRPPLASAALGQFYNPDSIEQALRLKAEHPQSRWIAGATDLGVELSHGKPVAPVLIALDRIAALRVIEVDRTQVSIGAAVPLIDFESRLPGVVPALDQMLPWFAARQVRNRATFGGNLGTASPIGDLLPALLALDAQIEVRSIETKRVLDIDGFLVGYRKTALADDELITRIRLPRRPDLISASYKVAKRQADDISIVAASFALALDGERRVTHARLAFGGVAALPLRKREVEAFLLGKPLDTQVVKQVCTRLQNAFTPLDDLRASADYRRKLCAGMFAKFVAEHLS